MKISNFPPNMAWWVTKPYRISDFKSDIQFEIRYPIRLGTYQAYPVNPNDVFEEGFSDTQSSGSRLTMLF